MAGPYVCGPHVVTLLDLTSIFELYMAKFVLKNRHRLDKCNEIDNNHLDLIVNTIGKVYVVIQENSTCPLLTF